jgi:hypothetical protein
VLYDAELTPSNLAFMDDFIVPVADGGDCNAEAVYSQCEFDLECTGDAATTCEAGTDEDLVLDAFTAVRDVTGDTLVLTYTFSGDNLLSGYAQVTLGFDATGDDEVTSVVDGDIFLDLFGGFDVDELGDVIVTDNEDGTFTVTMTFGDLQAGIDALYPDEDLGVDDIEYVYSEIYDVSESDWSELLDVPDAE